MSPRNRSADDVCWFLVFLFAGPEYSIKQIFEKARQYAPCYLVFEDLDTIVSDNVRSYFLNEVDGLKDNDGIFMIGSTNHLDRLDPGISVSRCEPLHTSSLHHCGAGSASCRALSLIVARNGRLVSTASTTSRIPIRRSASPTATFGRGSKRTTRTLTSQTRCARQSPISR